MRVFFSGPKIMGIRSGVSFGPEDFGGGRRTQKTAGQKIDGGFVYVVRGDHNLIKIGVSTNPNARLAQLRTGSAFPIDFAYVCAVDGPVDAAYAIEKNALSVLDRHRLNGEWFDCPSEMAVAAIAAASHKTGRKIVEVEPAQIDTILRLCAASPDQPETLGWFGKAMSLLIRCFIGAVCGVTLVLMLYVVVQIWAK